MQKLYIIISQTKLDLNDNFVKEKGEESMESFIVSNIVMHKLIISQLRESIGFSFLFNCYTSEFSNLSNILSRKNSYKQY